MRIEEKCGCGAGLTLVVDCEASSRLYKADAVGRQKDAWHQVDRWRKLHAGCRSSVNGPVYSYSVTSPAGEPEKDGKQ